MKYFAEYESFVINRHNRSAGVNRARDTSAISRKSLGDAFFCALRNSLARFPASFDDILFIVERKKRRFARTSK